MVLELSQFQQFKYPLGHLLNISKKRLEKSFIFVLFSFKYRVFFKKVDFIIKEIGNLKSIISFIFSYISILLIWYFCTWYTSKLYLFMEYDSFSFCVMLIERLVCIVILQNLWNSIFCKVEMKMFIYSKKICIFKF